MVEPHKASLTTSDDVSEHDGSLGQSKPPQLPDVVDSMPPPPDVSTLGKFQLLALLGRGGMGVVYLALSHGSSASNKLVVIKRLSPSAAAEPAFREMFLDEGRLAVRLNHPNVVQTYEVVAEGANHFLVMEYLEGQPLLRLMKSLVGAGKKLPPGIAVNIVTQALSGLQHAHELTDYDGTPLSVVHRDLSPHNIFVTYDGVVKLVDFGIAKAAMNSSQTQSGMFKGKPSYMAPEQFVGSVDARADLFAAGTVLWELLAHQRLAKTEDSVKAVAELLGGPPVRRVSSVASDIDPRLDAIVARALEKERDKRFQTAGDMRASLVEYVQASGQLSGQDDIARLMREVFAKKRESVRKIVQSYIRNPPPVDLDMTALLSKGSLGMGTTTGSVPTGSGVVEAFPEIGSISARPRSESRVRVHAVLLGAALLVVAGIAYRGFRGGREPPSITPAAAATGVAPPPAADNASIGAIVAPAPVGVPTVTDRGTVPVGGSGSAPRVGAASGVSGSAQKWSSASVPQAGTHSLGTPSPAVAVVASSAPPAPVVKPPVATPTPGQGRVYRTEL
jgi:serine/threonine protein kinase